MYPRIVIEKDKVLSNAIALKNLAASRQIELTPVVKALAGYAPLIRDMADLGFKRFGDATLPHFRAYQDVSAEKWLLRNPMTCEIPELVRLTDGSLVSEARVLLALEEEARCIRREYQVLLMAELGDLREGCEEAELLALVELAESLPHIRLMGLGANLSCFGNILPGHDNMAELSRLFDLAQERAGRPLERLSGGNSSSYLMLEQGTLPAAVNDLRLGESVLLGRLPCYDRPIEGLQQQAFCIEAKIVELKEKPSMPWGECGATDSFGGKVAFAYRGRRLRALAALGKQEIYINGLVPLDSGVEILGGCSDYLVLDLTESQQQYQLDDVLSFACDYAALATGMSSVYLDKEYL